MSGNGTCVIDGEKGATVGHLCRGHFERMAVLLRDIEDQAALLDVRPSMAVRNDTGGASLASERAPVRLEVLVHTDRRRGTGKSETDDDAHAAGATLSILDVLGSWARIVREERGLTAEGAATISGERDLLTRHLDWVAEQDWVDEAYDDLRTLAAQLRGANGTGADKPHCRCPALAGDGVCRGKVWIHDELQFVWRRYPDRCSKAWEQAPGSAVCDTCGSVWATDGEKARLKRLVEDQAVEDARPRTEDGRRMLTAQELVDAGLVSSLGNVRQIARRNSVQSVHGHYDPELFSKATA